MRLQNIPGRLLREVRMALTPVVAMTIPDDVEAPAASERFTTVTCSTLPEFQEFASANVELLARRQHFETALADTGRAFWLEGYCVVCKARTRFLVDYLHSDGLTPNWRERLECRRCRLANRVRAMYDALESAQYCSPDAEIYVTEQATPFYRVLSQRYARVTGSEFLRDGTQRGKRNARGIRHEDLTRLTLADASIDAICTTDVLEHIPNYGQALTECARCLKPGGSLFITVPFRVHSQETLVRARAPAGGPVEHLMPPEYHEDPLDPRGVLCYYHFGWDLLDALRASGFSQAAIHFYWSVRRGYLGGLQYYIKARRE